MDKATLFRPVNLVKGAGLPTTSTDGGAMSSPNNRGGAGGAYGGPDGDD
jgi:hypothetical protein